MSYTTFDLKDVAAQVQDSTVIVSGHLANVGLRSGTEVVQVFAREIGGVARRLAGFTKLRLGTGEAAEVNIAIEGDLLRWWDPAGPGWRTASGDVELEIHGTFGTRVVEVDLGSG